MEIYNQHHEEGKCEHAPIRGSIFFLAIKLLVILLLFDVIYGVVYYILTLGIALPLDSHHHISILIFVLDVVKVITQVVLIINVSLSWANNIYFINGKHLIKRTGFINTEEDMYEFNTVRSVTVNQSWLGKIFHYGDISLKTSASGGYQVIVTISGITDPQKYEKTIKECL